jgi:hypothetical protein
MYPPPALHTMLMCIIIYADVITGLAFRGLSSTYSTQKFSRTSPTRSPPRWATLPRHPLRPPSTRLSTTLSCTSLLSTFSNIHWSRVRVSLWRWSATRTNSGRIVLPSGPSGSPHRCLHSRVSNDEFPSTCTPSLHFSSRAFFLVFCVASFCVF